MLRRDITKLGSQGYWILGLLMAPVVLLVAFPPHWSWRVSPTAAAGAGVLVTERGDRKVFHEIACQVGYDGRGNIRGYSARFEANEGTPLAVEFSLTKDQLSQLGARLSQGIYDAKLGSSPSGRGRRFKVMLSEGWKQGSLKTPYGQFHFTCADNEPSLYERARSGPEPIREHSWFEGCSLPPAALPAWKRAWCKVRPGN